MTCKSEYRFIHCFINYCRPAGDVSVQHSTLLQQVLKGQNGNKEETHSRHTGYGTGTYCTYQSDHP